MSRGNGKPLSAGWLIAALFIASLNLRPAISSVSPVLDLIRSDLGMNASAASLLTSIPVLCMAVLSPISAGLGSRFGQERVIGWSLVLIGAGTLLRLAAFSPPLLLSTACLTGIGIAVMGPLLSGIIKKAGPRNAPMMTAVYAMALSSGAALGAGLSAPVQSKLHSWQTALALWALLALAAVPVWFGAIGRQAEEPSKPAVGPPVQKLPWSNAKAWLLTIHFGLMALVFYSLLAWLPPMLQSAGASRLYAGTLFTVFSVIQIPSGWILQMLLRRYPSRLTWLLAASILVLAGLILIVCPACLWLAVLICGLGSGMLFALGTLLPIDAASNPREAVSWAAMTQSAGYLIAAAGPIWVGWTHDASLSFGEAELGLIAVMLALMIVQCRIVRQSAKPAVRSAA
ncbi:CynX/NimT family MFS transporter [Cohnella caldifontis]|uniref:MFS transporter n=1 Tax=Cohnella caldifontis TaxID=3027471 RepID=UPI0023EBA5B5|nr:MFS transporter [Cohnella sp. YIM B05605]